MGEGGVGGCWRGRYVELRVRRVCDVVQRNSHCSLFLTASVLPISFISSEIPVLPGELKPIASAARHRARLGRWDATWRARTHTERCMAGKSVEMLLFVTYFTFAEGRFGVFNRQSHRRAAASGHLPCVRSAARSPSPLSSISKPRWGVPILARSTW